MAKVRMICAHCGSDEVRRDAYVAWDVATQQWEVSNVFDGGSIYESDTCQGGETTIEEEEKVVEAAIDGAKAGLEAELETWRKTADQNVWN